MKSFKRNRSKSSRSTSKANRRRLRNQKNRLRQLEALEDRQLLTAYTEPTTPNDTWQTANTVAVPTGDIVASRGQTNPWLNISGAITTRGDVDFFKFNLPARSGVFFDIDSREPNTQGGSTSLDTEIAVLAANGTTEIRKNDDGADFDTGFPLPLQRPGDGAGVDSAMYVDLNPGDYFVKVRSVGGTGNYVLRMLADTNYSTQFPSLTRTVPGATDWVYLDLDGHASTNDRWTRAKREDNGQVLGPYNAPAFDIATVAAQQNLNEVTPAERLYVHNYFGSFVENMSPFNVNVSTSIPANASFNDGEGYRIVLTSATAALHGDKTPDRVRGVAYDTSYTLGQADNNVGFVFAPTIDAPHRYTDDYSSSRIVGASVAAGETAAHEFGHALGLNHYPIGNPANGLLQSGRGSFGRFVFSSAATAPKKDTNGRITTPAFNQDDLAIISSTAAGGAEPADIPNNTFGYRADDHGNTTAAAQTLVAAGAGYAANGIIERVDDRDFFRFVANGNTTITADVNDLVGNLDTELRLYDANGQELAQHAPANSVDSTITRNLAAGTYFVDVRGAAQAGTKQGIVGQYRLNITTAVPTNAKPTVTLPSGNLAFAEGSPAVFLDAAATIADPDSANFNNGTLTLSLTAGADANDRVGILNLGRGPGQVAFAGNDVAVEGVKVGTFANGADARTPLTITLNANATVARTQTLLRNLVYLNVSENPTGTKTAQVVLSDGAGGTSTPANKIIQLTPVNDAPVLAANTQLAVNANAVGIITNTQLRTTDVDNTPAQLTYRVTTLPTKGTLAVGTRVLAANGTFTQADVDNGVLRYTNTGAGGADSFQFTVADAGGATATGTFNIAVTPAVNAAPTVAFPGPALAFTENGPLVVVDAGATVTDADSPNFNNGSLTYRMSVGGTDSDLIGLMVDAELGLAGNLATGADLLIQGVSIGKITVPLPASWPTTIAFNDKATVPRVQTVLRKLVYQDGSENPVAAKTIQVTLDDGKGGITTATKNVQVTAVNDAPVLAANTQLAVNANAVGIITNTQLRTTDVDNTPAQLTYRVTTLPTKGTLAVGTRVLAANGTFTQADVDNGVLRYTNTGAGGADSFQFTVADAGGATATGTFNIAVTPAVNAAPTVAFPGPALAFTENGPLVVVDAGATVTDADSPNFNNGSLTYRMSVGGTDSDLIGLMVDAELGLAGNLATGADLLIQGVSIGKITVPLPASWPTTIAFNDKATVPRVQTVLRKLVYQDGSENPVAAKTIQVTLDDGKGGITTATKNVQVTAVNDAPVLAANTQLTVNANAFGIITNTQLRTTDVDDGPAQLTYTVTTVPTNGTLQVGARNLAVGGKFTQADIDAGSLRYTNTGATNADAFRFTVADGAGGTVADTTFSITVNAAANTAPVLATNTGLQIDPDGTLTITNAMLNSTDADNPPATSLIYRITQGVQQGTLRLNGNFLLNDSTFSQDDINNNRVTYDSWDNANDTFQFTVTDGTATLPTATFNITKIARNAAPELAVDAAPTFAKVSEDAVSNQGMFVYELLSSVDGVDLIKDDGFANPPSEGIAMFGIEQDNGVWEYSLDAGRTWQEMGELSDSSARLLAADFDTMLRFIPNANFHGSVNASFRAWDRTDGVNGQLANATETGGDTCFSTASATATMTIDAVNDAPSFVIPFDDFVNVDAGPRVVEGFAEDIFDPEGNEMRFVVESFEVNADVRFEFELFETPTLTFTTPPSISPEGTLSYEVAPGSYGVSAFEAVLLDDGVDSKGAANFSSLGNRSLFFISALDLDIDDSQQVDVADGEMILRRLAGFQGEALSEGLTNEFSLRTLDEIDAVIAAIETEIMDIDLNGRSDALSDGILLMRYLEGNAGNALVDDVVDPDGFFTDAIEIGDFLCDYGLFDATEIEADCRIESQEATEKPLTEQTLQVEATEVALDGDMIEFDVQLTAEHAGLGLGLRMHYNSNAVSLNQLGDVLPEGLIQQQVLDDVEDFDNDPATDKFVLTLWADIDGMWPVGNEVTLFSPSFELAEGATNATFGFTDASLPLGTSLISSVTEFSTGALKGDFNGDNKVDVADFLILSSNFNMDVSKFTNGDLDGDGRVDFVDFIIFRDEFGNTSASKPNQEITTSQRRVTPNENSTKLSSSSSSPRLLILDQGGGCPCGGVGCQSCRPDEKVADASQSTESENEASDLPILSLLDQGGGCPCGGVGCLSCRGW